MMEAYLASVASLPLARLFGRRPPPASRLPLRKAARRHRRRADRVRPGGIPPCRPCRHRRNGCRFPCCFTTARSGATTWLACPRLSCTRPNIPGRMRLSGLGTVISTPNVRVAGCTVGIVIVIVPLNSSARTCRRVWLLEHSFMDFGKLAFADVYHYLHWLHLRDGENRKLAGQYRPGRSCAWSLPRLWER